MDNRSQVAVALLYDTRERGTDLRNALNAFGAPVVYEAATRGFDRAALEGSHANVVVVNLDAQTEPDLDDVYALLDDARYRVVFNDGDVSSGLSGWDQARWARHLAAKILGDADIDPPRPVDAEPVPTRIAIASVEPAQERPADLASVEIGARGATSGGDASDDAALAAAAAALSLESKWNLDVEQTPAPPAADESAAVQVPGGAGIDVDVLSEADFEALIDVPRGAASTDAPHLDFDADTDIPARSGGTQADDGALAPFDLSEIEDLLTSFDAAPPVIEAKDALAPDFAAYDFPDVPATESESASVVRQPSPLGFDDALTLQALEEDVPAAEAPVPAPREAAPISVAVPSQWSLEDMLDDVGELPPAPVAPAGPAEFGIQKMSAEEFLAPPADEDAPPPPELESVLSLELIPLEEAVAPVASEHVVHEAWLDPDAVVAKAKVRRVWVLGASIGGPESVREFLAEFPRDYPALFLLVQHLGGEFVDMMTRQLAKATPLTVRTPSHGERVGHGEVVVVPTTHRLLVDAEGVIVLERNVEETPYSPSIDRVLNDVADRFGANAGAIVFSGMSTDAVEGSRYLAGKGGRVYAQSPESCVVSSMVDGVCETGVVGFVGSPQELAEKLLAESK